MSPLPFLARYLPRHRSGIFLGITVAALAAFELFNFSTTEYALGDFLGQLSFAGVRWATILALAFCGMDFAGIARMFTPQKGDRQWVESWYLFGAWLLAATMNALLTWWAVTLALVGDPALGNEVLPRDTLLSGAPVFVALLVWLIRVLIIGSLTMATARAAGEQASGPATTEAQARPVGSQKELRPVLLRRRTASSTAASLSSVSGQTAPSSRPTGRTYPYPNRS
jgi:hypothetical protein